MSMERSCGWLVAGLIVALAAMPSPAWSGDDPGDEELHGDVSLGGHVSNVEDEISRVSEYDLRREHFEPDLWLDLYGRTGENHFDFTINYEDEQSHDVRGQVDVGPYVELEFDHSSLLHWLDHDRLANIEYREFVGVDTTGADRGGGKMATHEDTDPMGRYRLRHTETVQRIDFDLPFMPGTQVSSTYRDQRRMGFKQQTAVDHCSNCHVRSHRSVVNEQTRDVTLRLSTGTPTVGVSYELAVRDFDNNAAAMKNQFMQARHPVAGGSPDPAVNKITEFGSRLIFDNEELEIARSSDVRRTGHSVKVNVDLPNSQTLRGGFGLSTVRNQRTGLEISANAASVGWFAPLSRKMRMTASLVRRKVENDPILVDLPAWRDGRPGGGQDFDYTRYSVYDREEMIASAALNYALRPGHSLRFDYRLRSTDRDYLELDPDDASETRTLQNRLRVAWNGRLGAGARSRASIEYERTDLPFVNVDGICEEAIGATEQPLEGNSSVYYFQRERFGTGGNLPTQALRFKANLSHRLGQHASINGYLNFSDEKNDDLNLYDFERSVLSPGISAYLVPSETLALIGGVSFSKIESNAKFCIPVMDG